MKIKRLISAFAIMSMMSVTAFAANTVTVKPVDFGKNDIADKLTVTGTLDSKKAEDVMVIVAKPGIVMSGDIADENELIYQDKITAEADGSYSVDVILGTLADETGEYTVYVKSKSASPVTDSFYYAVDGERKIAIGNMNKESATDIEKKLSEYINTFSLDSFEALAGAEPGDIAAALENKGFDEDDHETVQKVIQESAVLSCYNNSKETYIVNADKEFKNADVIGLTALPSGSNLYDVYDEKLNDTGKAAVVSSLQNKGFASMEQLTKKFMEAVIVNGILNVTAGGGDHISEILTTANAEAIGDAGLKTAVANYLGNSSVRNQINSELLENTSITGVSDLTSKINLAIDKAKKTQTPSGGSGSGGSSGGSGSGYSGPVASGTGNSNYVEKETTFSDVAKSHWASEFIEILYDGGVISGYPDGSFKPNGQITREQAVKMLCEGFDIADAEETVSYTDVPEDVWFTDYIRNAVNAGFVRGISSTVFGVGRNITRQDLAVMIHRIMGEPEVKVQTEFTDFDTAGAYAKKALLYMNSIGVLNGYPDGTIRPLNPVTRAEAAKLICGCMKGGI